MEGLTLDQFEEFAEELRQQGFPVSRLDFKDKETKYSDETYDMWISAFTYAVMF